MRVVHQIKPKPVEDFICFMCLPIFSPIGMYLRGWMVCTLYNKHSFLPLLKPVTVAANLELILYTVNKTSSLFLTLSSGEIKFSKNPCTMDLYFYIFERLTYEKKPIFLKSMPQYKVFMELFGFISIYQNSYEIHANHTKSKIYFEGMDNTNLYISLF